MRSSKGKVYLENNFEVTALPNTIAKINVMIRELIENTNLAIRRGLKLELISHTGRS